MDKLTIIKLIGASIIAMVLLAKFEKDAFTQNTTDNIKVIKHTRKKQERRKRKKKYHDYIDAAWNEIDN